jgi:hypothetical protein
VRLDTFPTAVIVKSAVLQDVLPCSFVSTCRRFEETCCLRLQNENISSWMKCYWLSFQSWIIFTIYYLLPFFEFMTHAYNTIKRGITKNMIVKWTYICLILYLQRTYLFTLIPCSSVLHGKLTDSQLVKKFPAFYGIRSFITAFTRVRHLSLSCCKWVPVTTAWRVLRLRIEERPPKWRVPTNILNK